MEVFTVNETLLACYSQVLEGAFCWSNTCTRAHFFGGDWLQLNSKATRLMQSRSAVPPSSHDLTDRRANSLWVHGRAGGRQASDWLDRRSNRKRNGHLYDSSYFLPIFSVFILAMIRGRGETSNRHTHAAPTAPPTWPPGFLFTLMLSWFSDSLFATWCWHSDKRGIDVGEHSRSSASFVRHPGVCVRAGVCTRRITPFMCTVRHERYDGAELFLDSDFKSGHPWRLSHNKDKGNSNSVHFLNKTL